MSTSRGSIFEDLPQTVERQPDHVDSEPRPGRVAAFPRSRRARSGCRGTRVRRVVRALQADDELCLVDDRGALKMSGSGLSAAPGKRAGRGRGGETGHPAGRRARRSSPPARPLHVARAETDHGTVLDSPGEGSPAPARCRCDRPGGRAACRSAWRRAAIPHLRRPCRGAPTRPSFWIRTGCRGPSVRRARVDSASEAGIIGSDASTFASSAGSCSLCWLKVSNKGSAEINEVRADGRRRTTRRGREHRVRPRTYVGKGKELKERFNSAESVMVDDEFDPAQQRFLENALDAVVDRTQLILDIFAQHATSAEGFGEARAARVQPAPWDVAAPRAPRRRSGHARPGESQLETDRRLARRRISLLRGRLEAAASHTEEGAPAHGDADDRRLRCERRQVNNYPERTDPEPRCRSRIASSTRSTPQPAASRHDGRRYLTDTVSFHPAPAASAGRMYRRSRRRLSPM